MKNSKKSILLILLGLNGVAINSLFISLQWKYPATIFLILVFSILFGILSHWLTNSSGKTSDPISYLLAPFIWCVSIALIGDKLLFLSILIFISLWLGFAYVQAKTSVKLALIIGGLLLSGAVLYLEHYSNQISLGF